MKSMSAMCPDKSTHARQFVAQKAFALPTAIFLLVVLAALGAIMLTLSSVQHTTSAQDVQGARAYQAARAGIEWGLFRVKDPENGNPATPTAGDPYRAQFACAPPPVPPDPPATIGTINNLGETLSGFNVVVQCARSTYDEGGNRVSVYQLTSTATSGAGTPMLVSRQLTVTIGTCRQADDGACCSMADGATHGCAGG